MQNKPSNIFNTMKMTIFLNNKSLILIVMLTLHVNIQGQNDYKLARPKIDIVTPIFYELIDTTIALAEKNENVTDSSYFLYVMEMKCEDNYHCWVEVHSFTREQYVELPDSWNDGLGTDDYWPEGYLYRNGILCLVRTSYPGINFVFSNNLDSIHFPICSTDSAMGENREEINIHILVSPSVRENTIVHPFFVEE